MLSGHRGVGKTATVDMALLEADAETQENNETRAEERRGLLGRINALQSDALSDLRHRELIVLKLDYGQLVSGGRSESPAGTPPKEVPRRALEPRLVLTQIIQRLYEGSFAESLKPLPIRPASVKEQKARSAAVFRPGPSEERKWAEADDAKGKIASWQLADLQAAKEWANKRSGRSRLLARFIMRPSIVRLFLKMPDVARFLPLAGLIRLRWERRQRLERFWSLLEERILEAAWRASHQVEQEHVRERSLESVVERRVDLSIGIGVLLFLALTGVGFALEYSPWDLFGWREPLASVLQWAGVALAAGVSLGSLTLRASRRTRASDQVREVYRRDNSVPSLKRDLEEILALLRDDGSAAREFRIVVVLDELDKVVDSDILESVVEQFKNLFTLSRTAFVFITDAAYYDHVEEVVQEKAGEGTYAKQHTFFTHRMFLTRPEFQDVKRFLNDIDPGYETMPAAGRKANETLLKYLCFESRSHMFDLIALLAKGETTGLPGGLLDETLYRLGRGLRGDSEELKVEMELKANLQKLLELSYARVRKRAHQDDRLDSALLGHLYRVFDNPAGESFAEDSLRRFSLGENPAHAKAGREAAKKLVGLLEQYGALEREPRGGTMLRWTGTCRNPEPDLQMEVERYLEKLKDFELSGIDFPNDDLKSQFDALKTDHGQLLEKAREEVAKVEQWSAEDRVGVLEERRQSLERLSKRLDDHMLQHAVGKIMRDRHGLRVTRPDPTETALSGYCFSPLNGASWSVLLTGDINPVDVDARKDATSLYYVYYHTGTAEKYPTKSRFYQVMATESRVTDARNLYGRLRDVLKKRG